MIVIWEKFVKVCTNFGNLNENFNKNWEKFNENLKFFLLLILILSALKYLCSGENDPPVPPLERLLTVFCNHI